MEVLARKQPHKHLNFIEGDIATDIFNQSKNNINYKINFLSIKIKNNKN